MPHQLTVVLLALLLGLQAVTSDLYLPALPALTRELGGTLPQAQLTLSAMLLAFGVSQLFWGPLSDRFGRKPVLLAGLAVYVVASVAGALAPSMAALVVARAALGVGLGAAVMCARAIVRDLHAPVEAARTLSQALTGLGLMALLTVPVGALLTERLGWRAALLALTACGLGTLALVALRFPESLPAAVRAYNRHALQPAVLLRTWGGILRHRQFQTFAMLSVLSYGGLFTFLVASSFVFVVALGQSTAQYAWIMFTMAAAYIPGTFLCRLLLRRVDLARTIAIGGGITLCGGLMLLTMAHTNIQNPWALIVPVCLYMVGHGIHQSCGQSGAVGPFPQSAGAAAALVGFLMNLAAFANGAWLGHGLQAAQVAQAPQQSVQVMAWGMGGFSIGIAALAWTAVQRHAPRPVAAVA
jgi:MFS transporter, DHA1 family, multidrug resistance protein